MRSIDRRYLARHAAALAECHAAAELLPIGFEGSWIVGDRAGDIEAAKRAGCSGGVHVSCGHGSEPGERDAAMAHRNAGFHVWDAETIADVRDLIPLLQ